jgi:hypothetical protein
MTSNQSLDSFVSVFIPSTSEFLAQWHVWVHGKVSKHYKRDKDRIPDTVQRVRLRLLSKDFVSRWFFKHLTDDLVNLDDASRMLGGVPVTNLSMIRPIHGKRTSSDSLWAIKDILSYAKFDYERYFYSVQNHTIDTAKVLKLMGLGSRDEKGIVTFSAKDFNTLESLYRQGRLKPSEFTEHECTSVQTSIPYSGGLCGIEGCSQRHYSRGYCVAHYNKRPTVVCDECEKGKASLKLRNISLNHRWSDPAVMKSILKLRWNDSQLTPFLRNWNNSNKVFALPRYIFRNPKEATIDAGLLKYANMIIDNDVINHFKSMSRTDDARDEASGHSDDGTVSVFSAASRSDTTETESDVSVNDDSEITSVNTRNDLYNIIKLACLTPVEASIIQKADLEETSIKTIAASLDMSVNRVNKIRNEALSKLRVVALAG